MTTVPIPELKLEIKNLILRALKITDITPEQIGNDASLFDQTQPLHIDSVDALEIVMTLQRTYGVRLEDTASGRFVIKSVDTIAEFVARERKK